MFRFTIRDALWLMVVVALGLGWWVDHKRLDRVANAWETAVGGCGSPLRRTTA